MIRFKFLDYLFRILFMIFGKSTPLQTKPFHKKLCQLQDILQELTEFVVYRMLGILRMLNIVVYCSLC